MKRIAELLNQLLRDAINGLLNTAAPIVVWLCHHWVRTSGVDPSANHAANIYYLFSFNLWRGRTKIRIEMTKYICACSFICAINVSCIALTLYSTSWTKLRWDPKLTCFPGRQPMVDGCRGDSNECWVSFINQ